MKGSSGKRNTNKVNASDIFESAPSFVEPKITASSLSGFPPTAPGVKRIIPITSSAQSSVLTSNSPARVTYKTISEKKIEKKPVIAVPEGMIATPHGFIAKAKVPVSQAAHVVVQSPLSSRLSSVPTIVGGGNIPAPPSIQKKGFEVITPVEVLPIAVVPNMPPSVPGVKKSKVASTPWGASVPLAVDPSRPSSANTTSNVSERSNAGRPFCPIVSFGFGGKFSVMIPTLFRYLSKNIFILNSFKKIFFYHRPLNPLTVTPEDLSKPYRNGHVTIMKISSLISSHVRKQKKTLNNNSQVYEEIESYLDHINAFSGSLSSDQSTTNEGDVRNFIIKNLERPVSSVLGSSFFSNRTNNVCARDTYITSEKLLWSLLNSMIDSRGCIKSDVGMDNESSPENRIVNLLLGLSSSNDSVITTESKQLYSALSAMSNTSSGNKTDILATIEGLLLLGKRNEATQLAMDNNEW